MDDNRQQDESNNLSNENPQKTHRIRLYGVICGFLILGFQYGVYRLCNVIGNAIDITPFVPKIDAIDNLFPVVAIFIIPYVWSYVYWTTTPMVWSKVSLKHFLNNTLAIILGCLLGGIILIFAPTIMNRGSVDITYNSVFLPAENLLDRPQNNIFEWLLHFIYINDGDDGGRIAYNLFPSFHCMLSVVCLLSICRKKEIWLWYRIYNVVIFVLIILSTLFTKQHYFIDSVAGILIGVLAWFFANFFNLGERIFIGPINYFSKKLFAHRTRS